MLANDSDNVPNQHTYDTGEVAVEVLNASGQWMGGFALLQFHADGLVTIRSTRTGVLRRLPLGQWRDPIENAVLLAHGIQG